MNSSSPKFFKGNEYFNIDEIFSNKKDNTRYEYKLTFGKLENVALKFFYKDYKNYFYLPNEDMAIHKSMATFIDKDKKIKATKDNCYTKITDTFILIPDKPALQKKYTIDDDSIFEEIKIFKDDDNKSFIRLCELNDNEFLNSFVNYILK